MPTISLRLSEEEHRLLQEWAHDGRRSLQKEIIFRLFSNGGQGQRVDAGRTEVQKPEVAPTVARSPWPLRASADDHFKPDPKGGKS